MVDRDILLVDDDMDACASMSDIFLDFAGRFARQSYPYGAGTQEWVSVLLTTTAKAIGRMKRTEALARLSRRSADNFHHQVVIRPDPVGVSQVPLGDVP